MVLGVKVNRLGNLGPLHFVFLVSDRRWVESVFIPEGEETEDKENTQTSLSEVACTSECAKFSPDGLEMPGVLRRVNGLGNPTELLTADTTGIMCAALTANTTDASSAGKAAEGADGG